MRKSLENALKKVKKPPTKLMAIRMPTDLEAEIQKMAKKYKTKASKVVIEALRKALKLPEGRKR